MTVKTIAVALLACAVPSGATAAADTGAAEQGQASFTPEEVQADLTRYGAWLVRINEAQAPVSIAAQALRERWDAAMAIGDPNRAAAFFRPVVAEFAAIVERANAALALLANEDFPALDLAPDDRPERIVRELQQGNLALGAAVAAYNPLLDAVIRNDTAAAERAARQLVSGLRLAMQTQLVIARAGLAGMPRDEVGWEARNFLLLYYRTGLRILAAMPDNLIAGTDESLAADLVRLAEEVQANAEVGDRKAEASIADLRMRLRDAESARDATLAEMARRAVRVLEVHREIFPLTREFARLLRSYAVTVGSGRVTTESLATLFGRLGAVRMRFDEILVRESAALAGGS